MGRHEEFLKLCAAATAGELSAEERTRLAAHLVTCAECRQALREYEVTVKRSIAAMVGDVAIGEEEPQTDTSWSVDRAEKALFARLEREQDSSQPPRDAHDQDKDAVRGQRFAYRPSPIR